MTGEITLYAIIDNKANDIAAGIIALHRHHSVAIRNFREAMQNEQSPIHKYPEDYDLYALGYIKLTDDGIIAIEPRRELVISGVQMRDALAPNTDKIKLVEGA